MNRVISSISLVVLAVLFSFTSCNKEKTFQVKGVISSAEDNVLYFEHRALNGIEILDSVKLKGSGSFVFTQKAPQNPEFYQLRIGDRVAVFAVDSIESFVVEANGSDLHNTFKIEPAVLNNQIRKVVDMQRLAKKEIATLVNKHEAKEIDDVLFLEKVDSVLSLYKTDASKIILGNPSSAAAYYAVFQKIDDYLIFDPYNKKDYPMFGAVATSWSKYYPDTQRTKHLYDFTMNALRVRKQQEKQSNLLNDIPITETQLPDIALPNLRGEVVSLSSLKGNYVLLDFTVYKSDFSLKHNENLNRIYNKYRTKGLAIYQISLDSDAHFWKNVAIELPWITVYESQSVNSSLLRIYNVRDLPTAYLLNKEGEVIKRIEGFDELDSYINQLL